MTGEHVTFSIKHFHHFSGKVIIEKWRVPIEKLDSETRRQIDQENNVELLESIGEFLMAIEEKIEY